MISVEHVTKRYDTRHGVVTVLDDVNLVIQRGEKVGILGRNGAGKSTMIRLYIRSFTEIDEKFRLNEIKKR